jgi:hypothetical protein
MRMVAASFPMGERFRARECTANRKTGLAFNQVPGGAGGGMSTSDLLRRRTGARIGDPPKAPKVWASASAAAEQPTGTTVRIERWWFRSEPCRMDHHPPFGPFHHLKRLVSLGS